MTNAEHYKTRLGRIRALRAYCREHIGNCMKCPAHAKGVTGYAPDCAINWLAMEATPRKRNKRKHPVICEFNFGEQE